MINNIGLNSLNNGTSVSFSSKPAQNASAPLVSQLSYALNPVKKENIPALNQVSTRLSSQEDAQMYNEILNAFATSDKEKVSPQDKILRQKKLEALLKGGILLNKNSNDNSSVLQNLHKMIQNQRAANIDGVKIAGQVVDALYNPAIITQRFGDVPNEAQTFIMNKDEIEAANKVKTEGSGTCVSASIEFHMASKQPAEFARWVEGLTSPEVKVNKTIDLSSLSQNRLDAVWLLKQFNTPVDKMDFNQAQLTIKPDDNALARMQIQDNFWDYGERTIVDALVQSTLMNLGSQQTYNSLTDQRAGIFNSNPQGLIEFEKTYVESIVGNKERNSVVYQIVDEEQNLKGWNTDAKSIQNDITRAIDAGEDVIIGYVMTAKDCNEQGVNSNKIVNGHEITIVNYKKDAFGNLTFICNDTDDDKSQFIEYKADYLLPKIHHASYPVSLIGN